jgi:hypothetical protein
MNEPARGIWNVIIDGRPHAIAAEWQRVMYGGGRIIVDGMVVKQWTIGLRWPGAQQSFAVAGRRCVIAKRHMFDFELDLLAGEPGLGLPVAPPPPRGWLVLAIAPVVLLVLGVVAALVIAWAHGLL